ncbi:MAG TPA: D-glycero-beta-D-manno-heptose 1-phosphate adenylyltransferase [bacterium]|nr:D-glycero-beta-D-manno-heptose 1-phosphate adenylyltransferase [bacterium]
MGGTCAKIKTFEQMLPQVARLRRKGRTVVFTNGCFDLLHNGHVRYLAAARALGDVLVVGVNSDDSVRRIKGAGRPVVRENERVELLAGFWFVDYVFVFDDDDPLRVISSLLPDILVKGADWRLEQIVGRDVVEAHGGRVERIELVDDVSSSRIIELAKSLEA